MAEGEERRRELQDVCVNAMKVELKQKEENTENDCLRR